MLFIDNPIALFLAILTLLGILVIIFKKKKTPPASIKLRQPLKVYQKDQIVTIIKTEPLPATLMSLTSEEKEVDNLVEKHIKVDNDSHCDVDLDLSNYKYPLIELLDEIESGLNITAEELDLKKQTMLDIMNSFGIEIDKLRATVGPTFTFYELIPSLGVRISKIKNLENDIAVSLGMTQKQF